MGNNLVMEDEKKILSIQKYDIIRKFYENILENCSQHWVRN